MKLMWYFTSLEYVQLSNTMTVRKLSAYQIMCFRPSTAEVDIFSQEMVTESMMDL